MWNVSNIGREFILVIRDRVGIVCNNNNRGDIFRINYLSAHSEFDGLRHITADREKGFSTLRQSIRLSNKILLILQGVVIFLWEMKMGSANSGPTPTNNRQQQDLQLNFLIKSQISNSKYKINSSSWLKQNLSIKLVQSQSITKAQWTITNIVDNNAACCLCAEEFKDLIKLGEHGREKSVDRTFRGMTSGFRSHRMMIYSGNSKREEIYRVELEISKLASFLPTTMA